MGGFVAVFDAAAELDSVFNLRARKLPRITRYQPVVGLFDLAAIDDALRKHAVLVAYAVAEARQAEGCHRIKKARCKPAQAAVAERRIVLQRVQFVQVATQLTQRFATYLMQAERDEGVRERSARQKFHRQIVDAFSVLPVGSARGVHPALDETVTHRRR